MTQLGGTVQVLVEPFTHADLDPPGIQIASSDPATLFSCVPAMRIQLSVAILRQLMPCGLTAAMRFYGSQ